MSARQNYGFERRRKDQMRRAKQEEKRQRKSDRDQAGETGPEMGEAQTIAAPPDRWEWFSPSRSRTVLSAVGVRPEVDGPDDWVLLTEPAAEDDPAS
jgi:hypothetical protein